MSTTETKLQDVIQTSLKSIKDLIDTNTIVGTPITHPSGTVIIPVSKVSMAYATGGLDFADKAEDSAKPKNFGAGGGTGLSLQPIGFLVVNAEGKVDMLNVGLKNPSDPIEQIADLIERSPEIISRVKALIGKKKTDEE